MEFYNNYNDRKFSRDQIERLITISTPIMPHLAEELWHITEHEGSVTENKWPEINEDMLIEDVIEIPIQVNGKVRGRVEIEKDMSEEEVKQKVLDNKRIEEWLEGKDIRKFIYIDGKIVNIVV
jgi:leucyl-tRNA synthetase